MAFKKIMWGLQKKSVSNFSLSEMLELDKDEGFGIQGDGPGIKFYIPADAKIGGL